MPVSQKRCEFISDDATILSPISRLFRRCYPAVLPLFRRCYPAVLPLISAPVTTDKTKQWQ
jgi:hypothetical protein